MTERDRDAAGKPPLNSRPPRDGLGRPLPRDAAGGVPRIPDDVRLPPDESITERSASSTTHAFPRTRDSRRNVEKRAARGT